MRLFSNLFGKGLIRERGGGFIEVALRFADKGCCYDLLFLFSKPIELIDFLVYLGISVLDFTK
jgi:hypothetical protein